MKDSTIRRVAVVQLFPLVLLSNMAVAANPLPPTATQSAIELAQATTADSDQQETPSDSLAAAAQRPPNLSRLRRSRTLAGRSIRLTRAPNMFGDLFGSGSGTIASSFTGPGSLDGTLGQLTYPGTQRFPSTLDTFFIPSNQAGVATIPGVSTFNVGPPATTFFTTASVVPPASTFNLSAADQTQFTNLLNANPAQFVPQVAAAEAQNSPGASLTSAVLIPQTQGTIEPLPVDFLTTIPFVLHTQILQQRTVVVPSPSTGGVVVGRQKIAENGNPVPRDRVFVNYSFFDNAALTSDGVDVNRFVPGFEKTFLDGMGSIEVRVPLASTLSSDMDLNGISNFQHTELGNLWFTGKLVIAESSTALLTAGLTVTLPTADDLNFRSGSTDFIRVENESVHLMPFLGGVYAPNDRFFSIAFLQVDVDTNGNPVLLNSTGTGLQQVGRLNDVSFLFFDWSVGYWLYDQRDSSSALLTGIAPTIELHYNRGLSSVDGVTSGTTRIGNAGDRWEVVNAVFGATLQLGPSRTLGLAYSTPVGSGSDQQFDGEFRAMFNWFFGAAN